MTKCKHCGALRKELSHLNYCEICQDRYEDEQMQLYGRFA